MPQFKLVTTFYDENGEVVSQLSKDPASPDFVMSALPFLTNGCELCIAVREVESSNN